MNFLIVNDTLTLVRPFSPRMTKRAALESAILKWKTVATYLEHSPYRSLDGLGSETCALCFKYLEKGCVQCPVALHTGRIECADTPCIKMPLAYPHMRSHIARREAAFLKSLLPQKRKERS